MMQRMKDLGKFNRKSTWATVGLFLVKRHAPIPNAQDM